jgi:heavy metal sensor kinase
MAKFTRAFGVPKLRADFIRGLRFRLTLSYIFFFVALLLVIGFIFRKNIQSEMDGDVSVALEEEWGAAKGYIRFENERPIWFADDSDPEEAYIVSRLKHVFLLTDANGNVLDDSETYESIGVDSRQEIARILSLPSPEVHIRSDKEGVPYLIKAGSIPDDRGRLYFFAIGRSLQASHQTIQRLTESYFILSSAMIALSCFLGWALAGRALQPLNSVAQAAQTITGSNLSLQIPLRGAGDELDHLIDSFNRMTARLNQSFEQIRRFSTDVSHELRTPLTAIRGQLEVALFTAETPDQYRDAIVNALEDVQQLSSIVRALLLLSQAESGQLTLQKVPLDLAKVVGDVVDQFQIPAEEKEIVLSATHEPGIVVSADRTQVERLISNLVSNAIKYTPERGSVDVRTGFGDTPGWARIVVADSGVGIPAENLPHIFDRFYRVRNSRTGVVQGLGLGLSFVAWIVEAHGGRIDVASTVGEGTRFTVLLPLSPRTAEPVKPEHSAAVHPLA